jgi:hypothetical protein
MPDSAQYVPGTCNIGTAEIRRRKVIGAIGIAGTVILWAMLAALEVATAWRLVVWLPATVAAIGFLQARKQFCAKYGLAGEFSLGANVGETQAVTTAADRHKDRQAALAILAQSMAIGIAVAAVALFIP